MKKAVLGVAIVLILLPSVSRGATTADLEAQHIRLLEQIIVLLQTQLKELLALRGLPPLQVANPTVLTSVSTTSTSTPVTVKKKKSGGGGGGGGSSSNNNNAALAKETACRIAGDLNIAPTETKVAYIAEVAGTPVYASWAPDTTKELHDYLVDYLRNYEATGSQYYTHNPDYTYEYATMHIPTLETRLSDYYRNKEICGEEPGPYTFTPFVPASTTVGYTELIIKDSLNNPDATTLQLEEDAQSDWMSIFAFSLDMGSSTRRLQLSSIPLTIEVEGGTIGTLVGDLEIVVDGNFYGDWTYATGTADSNSAVITFNLEGHTLNLSEQVTVELQSRFKALAPASEGSTITASLTSDNAQAIQAESIGSSTPLELSGFVIGNTHSLRTKGIVVNPWSDSVQVTTIDGSINDYAEYRIEVEITAFGQDVYISTSPSISVRYSIKDALDNLIDFGNKGAFITSTALNNLGVLKIDDGDTKRFTFSVFFTPAVQNTQARLQLDSIIFGPSQGIPTGQTWTVFPVDDYDTDFVTIVD